MRAVAAREIDLAAIDAISYQLAIDAYPELAEQTRSIGLSTPSAGLPLVYPISNRKFGHETILQQLNAALEACESGVRDVLHIKRFSPVTVADYDSILSIEQQAIEMGYAQIH